jgi:hypothetical protein
MKTKFKIAAAVLLALTAAGSTLAGGTNPTAFDLVKEGNKYIGEQSKNKVVQIRSEKSIASLVPNIWYVVYYDPDATLKAVEVKFGGGQKMDVSHPLRLLEPITGADTMLDSSQLKVDSDRALKIAKDQPLLANLPLTATQFWLEHSLDGPRWKIKFWSARLNHPGDEVAVGDVFVSTASGSIVEADLHPEHVN